MTDTPTKTMEELETDLLILQQVALVAIQKALVTFNKAIATHVPDNNRLGSETGHVIARVATQCLAFENELQYAADRVDKALNPPSAT